MPEHRNRRSISQTYWVQRQGTKAHVLVPPWKMAARYLFQSRRTPRKPANGLGFVLSFPFFFFFFLEPSEL